MEDIILQYCYPRLDAEVSKHRNHLLKAPFCVHPKTGRVCVPVDPGRIDEFDPAKVPTVSSLLQELDGSVGWEVNGVSCCRLYTPVLNLPSDWQKTSLKQYIEMLDAHNVLLMDAVRRQNTKSGQ
jgi:DNA primase small subunit